MIKCPNCGSTAQVKRNTPFTDKEGNYINQTYVCECGCYFDAVSEFEEALDLVVTELMNECCSHAICGNCPLKAICDDCDVTPYTYVERIKIALFNK